MAHYRGQPVQVAFCNLKTVLHFKARTSVGLTGNRLNVGISTYRPLGSGQNAFLMQSIQNHRQELYSNG